MTPSHGGWASALSRIGMEKRMKNMSRLTAFVTAALLLAWSAAAAGVARGEKEAPKAAATIHVEGMDCPTCAKKAAKALVAIKEVSSAAADVEKKIIVVVAKKDAKPSAKAMWEAVEKAGFTPTKIEGPDGTFEKKPRD